MKHRPLSLQVTDSLPLITYNVDGALTDTVDGFGADIEFQYNQFPVLSMTGNVNGIEIWA